MFHHFNKAQQIVLMLLGIVVSGVAAAQEDAAIFPYQAIVRSDDAAVHSGPGKVHYVTGRLRQGDTVEVYRHDPGGWLAIRPPKGSFSLIPATALEELGNGVGEVAEEGTQAWVGTQLGPVEKPLWQIKLRAGEQVKLLGIATWPDPEGFTTSWYQIAPAAGEFRWIKQDDLNLPASVQSALAKENTTQSMLPQGNVANADYKNEIDDENEVALASFEPQDRVRSSVGNRKYESEQLAPSNRGWRKARFPIERGNQARNELFDSRTSAGFNQPSAQPPDRLASTTIDTRYDMGTPTFAGSTSGSSGFLSSGGYSAAPLTSRMTELELKLNQEMVKEPNQWRLIDLQSVAERVVASSSDPVEQVQAQRFLAKLENCRQLRDQFIGSGSARSNQGSSGESGRFGGSADSLTSLTGADSSNDFSLNTLYDAHGWLKELVRDGGRADPTYVLQDESGKVTHHVSPGPGMNLSSYVSKRIGIMGQRGYHTRLKLDHVTAHKIIDLKQTR